MKKITKATGAAIKDFFFNHWPTDFYHDDSEIIFQDETPECNWLLEDDKEYLLSKCGFLVGQEAQTQGKVIPFSKAFLDWFDKTTPKEILFRSLQAQIISAGLSEAERIEVLADLLGDNGFAELANQRGYESLPNRI